MTKTSEDICLDDIMSKKDQKKLAQALYRIQIDAISKGWGWTRLIVEKGRVCRLEEQHSYCLTTSECLD